MTIEQKLTEVTKEYEAELRNGSAEHASDQAKVLHGWIKALEWVLSLEK